MYNSLIVAARLGQPQSRGLSRQRQGCHLVEIHPVLALGGGLAEVIAGQEQSCQ
jgi:hypothetical protein